jgi:hypothetical protein
MALPLGTFVGLRKVQLSRQAAADRLAELERQAELEEELYQRRRKDTFEDKLTLAALEGKLGGTPSKDSAKAAANRTAMERIRNTFDPEGTGILDDELARIYASGDNTVFTELAKVIDEDFKKYEEAGQPYPTKIVGNILKDVVVENSSEVGIDVNQIERILGRELSEQSKEIIASIPKRLVPGATSFPKEGTFVSPVSAEEIQDFDKIVKNFLLNDAKKEKRLLIRENKKLNELIDAGIKLSKEQTNELKINTDRLDLLDEAIAASAQDPLALRDLYGNAITQKLLQQDSFARLKGSDLFDLTEVIYPQVSSIATAQKLGELGIFAPGTIVELPDENGMFSGDLFTLTPEQKETN